MSSLRLLGGMLVEPTEAFHEIEGRSNRSAIVPLLVTVAIPCILLVVYYNAVNIDWLLSIMSEGMESSQREALTRMMTKNVMLLLGIIGTITIIPLFSSIYALYFYVIGKIRNLHHGYGKWFAMVVWASVPSIFLLPVGLSSIFMAPAGQLMPEELNSVSLNQLVFHFQTDSPWKTLLESISLISLWSMLLMAVGYRSWARTTLKEALLVTLLPNALVYGAWSAIILLATAS